MLYIAETDREFSGVCRVYIGSPFHSVRLSDEYRY